MSIRHLLAGALCAAVIAAGPAAGASHDFFVHSAAYNPLGSGYQPAYITKDWLGGAALIAPADACGMRFTGDAWIDWHADDFALSESYNVPLDSDGNRVADVWLPSDDCGAWQGVSVETEAGLNVVPYDFSGYLETYSRGLWINSSGVALVYLHQPCHPMPDCLLGATEIVANGWADSLNDPVIRLRTANAGIRQSGTAALAQVTSAANALEQAATATSRRVQSRRTVDTRSLEPPLRQVEDIALRHLSLARERVSECATALGRGNLAAAAKACDEALRRTLDAHDALDTGDAWFD